MTNEKFIENHYQKVVEQNKNLQSELKEKSMQIDWINGEGANLGEFILKRYSWCTFLNTEKVIGFVDVEFISDHHRKIYVGIGDGINGVQDILNIVKYGTCIKDFGYAE